MHRLFESFSDCGGMTAVRGTLLELVRSLNMCRYTSVLASAADAFSLIGDVVNDDVVAHLIG
jgi:hypothetical protein